MEKLNAIREQGMQALDMCSTQEQSTQKMKDAIYHLTLAAIAMKEANLDSTALRVVRLAELMIPKVIELDEKIANNCILPEEEYNNILADILGIEL